MPISRTYDTIITISNTLGFLTGMVIVGNTTGTIGIIANINPTTGNLKVKLVNTLQEFVSGESIHANINSLTGGPVTNTIYFSNTANTVVNGNSYIIDGNTKVFPLPANYKPIFFDVISVRADGVLVPQSAYVWPASNLNEYGIEFLPRTVFGEIPSKFRIATFKGFDIFEGQLRAGVL